MDHIVVRSARPADFEAIRDLFDELDRYHATGEPALLRVPSVPRPDQSELDELIGCDRCFLAVAERAGEVVGFIEASVRGPEDPTDIDQPWCGIHNLSVKQSHRRQGIGAKLMRAAEEWARQKKLAGVRLNVFAFNQGARALYQQLGYRTLSLQLHKTLTVSDRREERREDIP